MQNPSSSVANSNNSSNSSSSNNNSNNNAIFQEKMTSGGFCLNGSRFPPQHEGASSFPAGPSSFPSGPFLRNQHGIDEEIASRLLALQSRSVLQRDNMLFPGHHIAMPPGQQMMGNVPVSGMMNNSSVVSAPCLDSYYTSQNQHAPNMFPSQGPPFAHAQAGRFLEELIAAKTIFQLQNPSLYPPVHENQNEQSFLPAPSGQTMHSAPSFSMPFGYHHNPSALQHMASAEIARMNSAASSHAATASLPMTDPTAGNHAAAVAAALSLKAMDEKDRTSVGGKKKPRGRHNGAGKVKSFYSRFRDLMAFKGKFGHCNVPYRYADDPSLGKWCSNLRHAFKQMNEGKRPILVLTKNRRTMLENAGFKWSLRPH